MPASLHDLSSRLPGHRLALSSLVVAAGLAGVGAPADTLPLKSTGLLEEALAPAQASKVPVFVIGDRMSGRPDLDTVIEGTGVLRRLAP